jgi:hypothetical protein
MKIRVKHRNTEIELEDIKTINHNLDIISLVKAISQQIQEIYQEQVLEQSN